MVEEYRNYHGKYFLTLIFASVLLFSFGILAQNVFAMGVPPGTCNNEYDGPIVSFLINNGTQTFDPISNLGVTFDVNIYSNYNATFVIHTPSTSSQGNSLSGTSWYLHDAYGYYAGYCTGGVGPNENVTVSRYLTHAANGVYSGIQSVVFGTNGFSGVSFNVNWVGPPPPPTGLVATAVSSSQINLSWTAPSSHGFFTVINYNIYRSTSSGTETLIATIGDVTSYSDNSVTGGQKYFYKVTAVYSPAESAPSNEASATTQQTPTLSVAVITNKPSYPQNSTIYVAVVVKSNSNPISGASITFHVCNPNNNCMTGTGTTNSNGNAIFKLAIPPNALTGTYTVDATASKSGYTSGSGKTTFQVT